MLFYVVGPTGVGKTTLLEAACLKLDSVRVFDVDGYIKETNPALYGHTGDRWDEFWQSAVEYFESLERNCREKGRLCFADVGAGCLQTEDAIPYFGFRNTIVIWDSPENVLQRVQSRPRSPWQSKRLEEFKDGEYSPQRKKVYDAATYRLSVEGLTKEQAAEQFLQLLDRLISGHSE